MELDKEYSVVAAASSRTVDRYALRIPQRVYQLLHSPQAVVEIEFTAESSAVLHVGNERFEVSAVDRSQSDNITDCYTIDNANSRSSDSGDSLPVLTYEGKVSKRLQVFGNIVGMMEVAHEKTSLEKANRGANKVVKIGLPDRLVKAKAAEAKAVNSVPAKTAKTAPAITSAPPPPAAPKTTATPKTTNSSSSSSSSGNHTLFLRIDKAPAGISFESITAFFSGIKIASIYVHCASIISTGSSSDAGADSVYVEFESANGHELALQRSGEEMAIIGGKGAKGAKRARGNASAAILLSEVCRLETFFIKGNCLPLTAKISTVAACALVLSAENDKLALHPRLLQLLAAKSPSLLLEEWRSAGLGTAYAFDASYIGGCLPGAAATKRRRISEAIASYDDHSSLHLIVNSCVQGGDAPTLAQMFMEDGSSELQSSRKGSGGGEADTLLRTYVEATGLLDDAWVQHLLLDEEGRASGAYLAVSDYLCRARDMCEGIVAAYWTHSVKHFKR